MKRSNAGLDESTDGSSSDDDSLEERARKQARTMLATQGPVDTQLVLTPSSSKASAPHWTG
ncbi:hypothetical protein [Actinophytocola oryzae]|uniref:Uncharacterized protein n=1 Tax=Actinophytocola oryzae TaxID=502181 RepID=A0A4R7W4J3_9PSEU|nr:hypothetical protein [Actinophytocola oryzae]TDV57623.1 hypothetical protein CLV71_101496 [Actinophytocola oryzae]